jgi:ribosomal protein L40E
MSRIYDQFQRQLANDKVMCLNCGAINPLGLENCENCDNSLEQPRPLLINMVETIVRPQRAMARIAATMPVMQAFLAVVAVSSVYLIFQMIGRLTSIQSIADDLSKVTSDQRKILLDPNFRPVPGAIEILSSYFLLILSWLFFSMALFYATRLLYRKEAHINFKSLASVAGFGRVITLFTFLFFLPIGDFGIALQWLLLAWQVAIDTIGVRFSTGLTFNKAILVVIIPTMLFVFLLSLPI